MDARLQSILAELRQGYEKIYGDRLVKLVLYGSQARGDARPDSDIDVAVVLKGPVDGYTERRRTDELDAALSLQHDVVILPIHLSAERFSAGSPALIRNIHQDGIEV